VTVDEHSRYAEAKKVHERVYGAEVRCPSDYEDQRCTHTISEEISGLWRGGGDDWKQVGDDIAGHFRIDWLRLVDHDGSRLCARQPP